VLLAVLAAARWDLGETLVRRFTHTPPLALGLGQERLALIETLKQQTTTDAASCGKTNAADPRRRTGRFAGRADGPLLHRRLDPNVEIEHGGAGLVNQSLRARPLSQWSDAALESYCKRYNVAWVACWSPEVVVRLQAWSGATLVARMNDGGPFIFSPSPRRRARSPSRSGDRPAHG